MYTAERIVVKYVRLCNAYQCVFLCFLQMYVTLVWKTKGTRLTKPTLCLTLVSLAVLVGIVRVAEYRNHWSDVLAGYLTGGAIAAFLVRI